MRGCGGEVFVGCGDGGARNVSDACFPDWRPGWKNPNMNSSHHASWIEILCWMKHVPPVNHWLAKKDSLAALVAHKENPQDSQRQSCGFSMVIPLGFKNWNTVNYFWNIMYCKSMIYKVNNIKTFQECGAKFCFGGAKLLSLHHITIRHK